MTAERQKNIPAVFSLSLSRNYFFLSEKLIFNEKLPISAGVYGSLHKASGGEKSSGIEYLVATRLILTNFD